MEDFIESLGNKLSKETNKRDISEEKLRDSLLAAVSSLPSCDIKNDLVDNFEAVFDKLEKFRYICKQQPTHVTMDLTGVDKLTTCLTGISNEPAHKMRNELYSKLVTCSVTTTPGQLPAILAHWADSIEQAPPNDVINAVSTVSRMVPYCPSSRPLIRFILQAMSVLLSKRKALHNNGLKLLPLKKVLFGVIVSYSGQRCHGDLLAALLSLYLELNAQLEDFPLHHVTSLYLTVLGHSPELMLNAMLQVDITDTDVLSTIAPLVARASEHVMICHSVLLGSEPLLYMKVYCSVLLLLHSSHFKAVRNLFDSIDVPSNLNEWVWSQSPSVCKQLTINETWSSQKIKKYLLRKVSEKQLQLLLNLLNGEDTPPTPPSISPTPPSISPTPPSISPTPPSISPGPSTDLFYVDNQRGGDRNNEGGVVNPDGVDVTEDVAFELMTLPKSEESADNDNEEDIARQQQLCLTPLFGRGSTVMAEEKVSSHQHKDPQQGEEEDLAAAGDGKRLLSNAIDDSTLLEETILPKQKKSRLSKVTTPKVKKKASPKPRLLRSTAKRRGIVLNTLGEIMN